ncbi:MAG: ABC-2 type transport system permease protein [Bacteriovoracaceae bacterium]|jgi:ABC-2 type transport system permease protein
MIRVIFLKEIKVFFRSPITYVIAGLFTLLVGWLFFNQLVYFVENIQKVPVSMRNQYDFANEVVIKLFGNVNFLLLFIAPIMAMRSFSEEYREGTIDLYFTSPVADYELIIAKYLSVVVQGLFLLSTTLIFPFFLSNLDVTDTSFIFTGYLGLVLNLVCFTGLGCFASTLGKNQLLAALAGFVLVLFSWMIAMFSQMTSNYLLAEILRFLSINHHYENFVKGNISLADVSFYMSFIMLNILMMKKRIEVRHWK